MENIINDSIKDYSKEKVKNNDSLNKVLKGSGIVLLGTIIGMFLSFITRIILARSFSQVEYGMYSIGFAIFSVISMISTVGMNEGAARQISYYNSKQNKKNLNNIISSSIIITLIIGFTLAGILFYLSDSIALYLFHNILLGYIFKIFSFAVPFSSLIIIFISIFRGFESVKPNVYFQQIGKNIAFLLLIIIVIIFNLNFKWVIWSFTFSTIIISFIFVIYINKKLVIKIKILNKKGLFISGWKLIYFSLPLLITAILNLIIGWTDTIMLGYYETSEIVGIYNIALPLAGLLPIGLTSMIFIYTPISSRLYSQNQFDELKRNYSILTKWVFSITIPILFIFLFFPYTVIKFLFGNSYVSGAIVLPVLSIGFFTHTFLGPNGSTLISFGKTKVLMYASLISAILNIILNILLIPSYNILGASIATTSSLILANVILSISLYYRFKVHPFTRNYLKPVIIMFIFILFYYFLFSKIFEIQVIHTILFFFSSILVYILILILTKSIEKEDLILLSSFEKKIGIKFSFVRKLLKKIGRL